MKKFAVIYIISVLISLKVLAQSPDKMSYQAVIRNSENELVTNEHVRIKFSILQGSVIGKEVYSEIHYKSTNSNGLVSLEIGNGEAKIGDFNSIKWGNGPYFIKTETDPTGGTNYTITGISQLLSVPYSLYSKSADTVTGKIYETDPLFQESVANTITELDKQNWNRKLDSNNEKDPVFSKSVASGINKYDTLYWSNKQNPLIAGTGISIVNYKISATFSGRIENFYLGQDTLGGIVFYIYIGKDNRQHGLIVAKTEISAKWDTNAYSQIKFVGANSSWDGAGNTALMTNNTVITDYLRNLGEGWYIPSIDELMLLFNNRFHVNKDHSGSVLLSYTQQDYYWSSSEPNGKNAMCIFNSIFNFADIYKSEYHIFRAIRAF